MAGKRIDELNEATNLNLGDHLLVLNNSVSRKATLQTLLRKFLGTEGSGTYRAAKIVVASDGTVQSISSGLLSASVTQDFASILAGAEASFTISISGAAVGDAVAVALPAAFPAGLSLAGAWVSDAGTVTVKVRNTTASPIDPASATYGVVVHKL